MSVNTQALHRAHDLVLGVIADQLDCQSLVVDDDLEPGRNADPADEASHMRELAGFSPLTDQPIPGRPSRPRSFKETNDAYGLPAGAGRANEVMRVSESANLSSVSAGHHDGSRTVPPNAAASADPEP